MKRRTMLYLALVLVLLTGILTACGERPTNEPMLEMTETVADPTVAPTEEAAAPTAGEGEAVATASGLQFISIQEGTGRSPEPGDVVSVHYLGTLEDGTEFDSSYSRGEPISFPLGQGQVIPGWEEGIAMLREGGKARLIIPPDLAYGSEGAGGVIPPDATLIFEVELVSISEGSPDSPVEVDAADYVESDTGLKYYDLQEGSGAEAEPGTVVMLHYTGWLGDGTKFDSSIDRGSSVSFPLGEGAVLPGWEEGVTGMKVGGKRQIVIPPALGYGSEGAGGVIPPDATLILEVDLLDVLEGAPAAPAEVAPATYVETDSGLKYYDLRKGEGPAAETGQMVQVHYTGWLEDGTKFDSSLDRGEPFSFVLGSGQVIPGWDEGVAGMQVGGYRQLVIPPDLAYGADGAGEVIPPNSTLIFEVELLAIQAPQ
ncbi:MAG TPA: FKBP-type peptidyl-prolyl cis-trans isomerase [Anaerolineae bacterium]|nr:FKBP-type peptidyl-prolyl cis-trans isomerase [Anaerolineae bacterium]